MAHSLDPRWMGISQGVDRNSSQQVQVFLAIIVDNDATLAVV